MSLSSRINLEAQDFQDAENEKLIMSDEDTLPVENEMKNKSRKSLFGIKMSEGILLVALVAAVITCIVLGCNWSGEARRLRDEVKTLKTKNSQLSAKLEDPVELTKVLANLAEKAKADEQAKAAELVAELAAQKVEAEEVTEEAVAAADLKVAAEESTDADVTPPEEEAEIEEGEKAEKEAKDETKPVVLTTPVVLTDQTGGDAPDTSVEAESGANSGAHVDSNPPVKTERRKSSVAGAVNKGVKVMTGGRRRWTKKSDNDPVDGTPAGEHVAAPKEGADSVEDKRDLTPAERETPEEFIAATRAAAQAQADHAALLQTALAEGSAL